MLREDELVLLENLKIDNEKKTEEISQLRNNQIIGQAEGEETITITDGAFAFTNILEETEIEVEGKKKKVYIVNLPQGLSKQETREGYNLFNAYLDNQNLGGVDVSFDEKTGTITLNGTCVETKQIAFKKAVNQIQTKANVKYTFEVFKISGNYIPSGPLGTGDTSIQLWDNSSGEWKYPYQLMFRYLTTEKLSISKTYDEDILYNQAQFKIEVGDIFENFKIKVQFSEGDSKDYEQYGAMPSLDFPSEIENLKAYNLFDKDNVINDKFVSENINSHKDWCYYESDKLQTGKTYFPSHRAIVSFFNEDTNISYIDTTSNFVVPENTTKVYISILKTALEDFMLVEEKNLYKPYAEFRTINVNKKNKNILPVYYEKGHIINTSVGPIIEIMGKNKIKINGTCINALNFNFIYKNIIHWHKNKTYSLQFKIISGSYKGTFLAHTSFLNDKKSIYNNCQMDISNNFRNKVSIYEDGYSDKFLFYAIKNTVFDNLVVEIQIEKNSTTTEIIEQQNQQYQLKLDNIELNGIDNVRDSLIIELEDEKTSYKKIKKLYKRELFETEKTFLDNENWILFNNSNIHFKTNRFVLSKSNNSLLTTDVNIISNKFKNYKANFTWNNDVEGISQSKTEIIFNIDKEKAPDLETFKELLKNENISYVCRKNEELIDLTNNKELVQDLENLINNITTYEDTTHIEVENGYLQLEYVKSNKLLLEDMQNQIDNIQKVILEGGIVNE